MKDVKFTVEFTQHVLANSAGPNGTRDVFQRDGENKLIFQQSWWFSAFRRAIEMEHIRNIKAGDISMDLSVDAPTEMYSRRYGRGETRIHEAIMPGTKVTFNAVVDDSLTESVLRRILERMGRFVGLSPYGHKLGYGHFRLLELIVAPSEAATKGQTV
jgi:hypothetical protein